MVFLGLVLAVSAIAIGTAIVIENTGAAELSAFGETVPGITAQWHIFLAGAVVAILLMSGLTAFMFGLGRSIRTRRELRDLREEHEESITTLEMEKRQLQRELARIRRGPAPDPTHTAPRPKPPHHPVPQ